MHQAEYFHREYFLIINVPLLQQLPPLWLFFHSTFYSMVTMTFSDYFMILGAVFLAIIKQGVSAIKTFGWFHWTPFHRWVWHYAWAGKEALMHSTWLISDKPWFVSFGAHDLVCRGCPLSPGFLPFQVMNSRSCQPHLQVYIYCKFFKWMACFLRAGIHSVLFILNVPFIVLNV